MNQSHQNLARSWRPKQFAQIVGQPLPVKMLQNSLYTNHFFPVYLFSGQRGCGKTTTARVFAAALNCEKLIKFQKDPKNILPCGSCQSCSMMAQGKHPDFIEMDAASHTGVDNVRSIVDAASFMPLAGQKRVYLIDEAHMLSKAAFNAFLKILEEPPSSVLFILATTDPHKIIDTVRSRCFQLFFDPVATDIVAHHLKNVCTKEEIAHDDAGLQAVVANSEGSVRDALNLLEQVRFSADSVTKRAVLDVLGHVDEEQIEKLFCALLASDASQLQIVLQEINFSSCTPEPLWHALCCVARDTMWHALGVETVDLSEQVTEGIKSSTPNRAKLIFETLCSYEIPLKKTTKKHLLLEMMFLRLCGPLIQSASQITQDERGRKNNNDESTRILRQAQDERNINKKLKEFGNASQGINKDSGHMDERLKQNIDQRNQSARPDLSINSRLKAPSKAAHPEPVEGNVRENNIENNTPEPWQNFLIAIRALEDNLLVSIFEQAQFRTSDQEKVVIAYAQTSSFFDDHRNEKQSLWQPVLEKFFGAGVKLAIEIDESLKKEVETTVKKKSFKRVGSRKQAVVSASIDISDKEQWKTTHLLLQHFGGTVRVIKDDNE